jgi:signal transduction histidine kinase
MNDISRILLVDDSPTNLEVLSSYLKPLGYALLFATSGERAIEVAQAARPDLILLDIMLPGIDGYETCRRIHQALGQQEAPVLFLSALDAVANKVKGFESGGVDYISKPFQKEELIARVKTHLELFAVRRENRRYAAEMESLAQQRARALVHADRLATLGTLSAGVAHEINNPATFISVGIQTMARLWNDIEPVIAEKCRQDPAQQPRLAFAIKNIPDLIANIKSGVSRIQKVVKALRTYAHAGASIKERCDIGECINDALDLCHNRLKYAITVEKNGMEALAPIYADAQHIVQVFVNLFTNAADAMNNGGNGEKKGILRIGVSNENGMVRVIIDDSGNGIATDHLQRIWDPFFTTKSPESGTGLGLSITRDIIVEHGGTIKAENRPEGGARFTVSLPRLETAI